MDLAQWYTDIATDYSSPGMRGRTLHDALFYIFDHATGTHVDKPDDIENSTIQGIVLTSDCRVVDKDDWIDASRHPGPQLPPNDAGWGCYFDSEGSCLLAFQYFRYGTPPDLTDYPLSRQWLDLWNAPADALVIWTIAEVHNGQPAQNEFAPCPVPTGPAAYPPIGPAEWLASYYPASKYPGIYSELALVAGARAQ